MNDLDSQDPDPTGRPVEKPPECVSPGPCAAENRQSGDDRREEPRLKRILGAMLFGARGPVSVPQIRAVLQKVAGGRRTEGAPASCEANDHEIRAELDRLKFELASAGVGLDVKEVAGGYRMVTDPECGPWLRELLNVGKAPRLSRPALETLAIIAFRQPVTRPEIESVRGVSVDSIVRNLLEAQLVRVTGRSDLPGRPMLYGTTQLFLEHFGLRDLKELPCPDEMLKRASKSGGKGRERSA